MVVRGRPSSWLTRLQRVCEYMTVRRRVRPMAGCGGRPDAADVGGGVHLFCPHE